MKPMKNYAPCCLPRWIKPLRENCNNEGKIIVSVDGVYVVLTNFVNFNVKELYDRSNTNKASNYMHEDRNG